MWSEPVSFLVRFILLLIMHLFMTMHPLLMLFNLKGIFLVFSMVCSCQRFNSIKNRWFFLFCLQLSTVKIHKANYKCIKKIRYQITEYFITIKNKFLSKILVIVSGPSKTKLSKFVYLELPNQNKPVYPVQISVCLG